MNEIRVMVYGASVLGNVIASLYVGLGAHVKNFSKYTYDITDSHRIDTDIALFRPNLIFNCAEKADLHGCERRPEGALAVNAVGAAKIALACRVNDIELVHISTDMVFSGFGGGGPYKELDKPYPVQTYGLSKLLGENAVKRFLPVGRFTIVRVGWLYGADIQSGPAWDAAGTFVKTEGGTKLTRRAWIDPGLRGTPTHVGEAAFQIVKNVHPNDGHAISVVHVGPDEPSISWYHFLEDDFPLIEQTDLRKMPGGRDVTMPRDGGLRPTEGWATEGYADSLARYRRELKEHDSSPDEKVGERA
jgi:dTDP-4-dehydrorhamnose reductase